MLLINVKVPSASANKPAPSAIEPYTKSGELGIISSEEIIGVIFKLEKSLVTLTKEGVFEAVKYTDASVPSSPSSPSCPSSPSFPSTPLIPSFPSSYSQLVKREVV